MPEAGYQVMPLLCALVAPLPIGTNLGLLHLLWLLSSGRLLTTRGAVIPGLSEAGLTDGQVRRAWSALGQGAWTSAELVRHWAAQVEQAGQWPPHTHAGYRPVAVDVTGFWRPRLQGCPTTHFSATAGKVLPAIPLGLIARIGSGAGQRVGVLLGLVRADPTDPSPRAHARRLLADAVARCAPDDARVVDGGFGVALLQEVGATASVARVAKNFTARRATPPAYTGRGRRPTRGEIVRPLSRRHKGRFLPATPPDRVATWTEGTMSIRAEVWTALVLPAAAAGSPTFAVVAIHDPRYRTPWLLVTPQAVAPQAVAPQAVAPQAVRALYRDRWPVEQVPLAAKQMLGAARQFVHAPETCQRLPELALLAGAIVHDLAATMPPAPPGFWDRHPRPTPGRLRRVLARCPFPHTFPLPARLREKTSATAHLPKGRSGQRPTPATAPAAEAA